MNITKSSFGITNDGEEAFLYRLENTSRRICYHNQLWLPRGKYLCSGQTGTLRDVCLGYDTLAEYEKIRQVSVPLSADMQTVLKKVRSH